MLQSKPPSFDSVGDFAGSLSKTFEESTKSLLLYAVRRQTEIMLDAINNKKSPSAIDQGIDYAIMSSDLKRLQTSLIVQGYVGHVELVMAFTKESKKEISEERKSDFREGALTVLRMYETLLDAELEKCKEFVEEQGLLVHEGAE